MHVHRAIDFEIFNMKLTDYVCISHAIMNGFVKNREKEKKPKHYMMLTCWYRRLFRLIYRHQINPFQAKEICATDSITSKKSLAQTL